MFLQKGTFYVGFEINRQKKFFLKFKKDSYFVVAKENKQGVAMDDDDQKITPGNLIGAYFLTFNKRSEYVYRSSTECLGFSIRKKHWMVILNHHPKIGRDLREQIKKNYYEYTKSRIQNMYDKEMSNQLKRADYEAMLRVVNHKEFNKEPE